jgi:hypothetical protein
MDDRQARGVEIVKILFRIKMSCWSPWLQKFTEEADLSPAEVEENPLSVCKVNRL